MQYNLIYVFIKKKLDLKLSCINVDAGFDTSDSYSSDDEFLHCYGTEN
jgi:hypothetical protein